MKLFLREDGFFIMKKRLKFTVIYPIIAISLFLASMHNALCCTGDKDVECGTLSSSSHAHSTLPCNCTYKGWINDDVNSFSDMVPSGLHLISNLPEAPCLGFAGLITSFQPSFLLSARRSSSPRQVILRI
jgi:hypothetical protein